MIRPQLPGEDEAGVRDLGLCGVAPWYPRRRFSLRVMVPSRPAAAEISPVFDRLKSDTPQHDSAVHGPMPGDADRLTVMRRLNTDQDGSVVPPASTISRQFGNPAELAVRGAGDRKR